MVNKITQFAVHHKVIASVLAIALVGGGYWGFKKFTSTDGQVRYILATAEKGTLVSSVSGSGQVTVSSQVDVKAKAGGDVVYVGVKNGQEVKMGTLLVQLDARDANKAVRDAEANLLSARLSLQKLKQPADQLSVLQAENSLAQSKESKQKAEDDLAKEYEDGFNTVANAFLDLPAIMTGLQDTLYSSTIGLASGGQWNINYYADAVKSYDEKVVQYQRDTDSRYQIARTDYDLTFNSYKTASRFSDKTVIESLIDQTYETSKEIAEAIKATNNLIQFYQDKLAERNLRVNTISNTHLTALNGFTGKANSHLLSLLAIQRTIQTSKETITNAERSIAERTESLAKLKAGADELDIQSQELSVKQRENTLADAKEKLADYFIRSPFDGVVAVIDLKKGDSISSGGIISTMITKQQIAEISLNEVDVAKIAVGQKTTLTFDALANLSLTGLVGEIDSIGTVSQGVVSYIIKIAFDAQDERVKPGMSVSSDIITNVKADVLLVPNSAVKSQGDSRYVEVPVDQLEGANAIGAIILSQLPIRQTVEIGMANDDFTEIVSGLKEGDLVVTNTITSQANGANGNQQSSNLRIPGMTGGGGGLRR
ncbi:MAG: efflux RND transporter periplasmic adaptor subunit [bacterium]